MNRHLGIDLNLPALLVTATLALLTGLALSAAGITHPALWIAVNLLIAALGLMTYRSRTAAGWLHRRLTYRRRDHKPTTVLSTAGVGIRWDGQRALAYIEILPAPYESTIIGADHETTAQTIPVDVIRDELVQFDIHCDAVTLITTGHKFHRPTDLAVIYHAALGPTPVLLHGRTFIEIAVALSGSLDSVYARSGNDGIPTGIVRTVSVAAERIRRRLIGEGIHAQLLSPSEATEIANTLTRQFTDAIDNEHWDSAGPAAMRTVGFSVAKHAWTADNYRQWCRLNAHRQLHAVRLERHRGNDYAQMYLAFQTNDPAAISTVAALGLRREYGQQTDILSTALPGLRTTLPTAVPAQSLDDTTTFPIPLIAGGAGTFLGHTKSRAQVFVNFSHGSTPFYIISPAALCQQLLLRLATSGQTIDINIDGPEWKTFADRIGATHNTNPAADVIVTADTPPRQQAFPTQARLVWTTTAPTDRPDYAIVAGPQECSLYTPTSVTHYLWSTSSAEEAYFTTPAPGQRAVRTPAVPPPPPLTPPPPPLIPTRRRPETATPVAPRATVGPLIAQANTEFRDER